MVEILLYSGITSSQCMECWETPCEFVPQRCAYIMHGVAILIFSFLRLNCTHEEADDRVTFHVKDILRHRSEPTFMTLSLGATDDVFVSLLCHIKVS